MKTLHVSFILLFTTFLFLLASCRNSHSNAVTPENIQKVIPGKQMGNLKIDQDASTALDSLPKPDFSDAAMGKVLLKWEDVYGDSLFMFNTQKMGIENFKRIKILRSYAPVFRTPTGLGVGSNETEIKKEFTLRKQGYIKENGKTYTLLTNPKGIGFEIDTAGNCRAILVFAKKYYPAYLPFYLHFERDTAKAS